MTDATIPCPICLHDIPEHLVVQGSCQHPYCEPCIERILLSPSPSSSSGYESPVATPTLGSCPICRQDLYLFDLRFSLSGELVHNKEEHGLPEELVGSVFVETTDNAPGVIGRGSYHFPPLTSEENAPYYNMTRVPSNNIAGDTSSEDEKTKIIRFSNYHWHAPTRTFAGMLKVDSKLFKEHFVVLSFSADWRFVRQGVVQIRRRRYDDLEELHSVYPFDGKWKLVDSTVSSEVFSPEKILTVEGFCVKETMGTLHPYFIRPNDENDDSSLPILMGSPFSDDFVLADRRQLMTTVGDSIRWVKHDDNSQQMTWLHESVITDVPPNQTTAVGGSSGRLLVRSTDNEEDTFLREQRREEPPYNRHSVWGNCFCQGLQVGLASYHFGSLEGDGVYISYENPATGMWPPLDNGLPIPSRVNFRNISFDAESRTFRGEICWLQDFGTTWQSMAKWTYEMVFDSSYTCIASGQVHSFTADHSEVGQEMSRYGESLNYCNAKLWDIFRDDSRALALNSDHEGIAAYFRESSASLRRRLQNEGASVRTIALLHRVLTEFAQDPDGDNPINFNL